MTYSEILTHIFSRGRFGMKPGLERVTEILARLDNPHRKLKIVQIAGTNGKGSTGAFLSSIMTAGGYRTAFFSSPHLINFSERFRIDDTEVSEDILYDVARRVLAAAPEEATFFEIVTAIAFLLFAEANVDLAIMEAGMGGRWDATNVSESILSIITPISLDHCAWLGDTLALIAKEKAGIIKPETPLVIAPQETEALLPLLEAAANSQSKVYLYGSDFTMETSSAELCYRGEGFFLRGLKISLQGGFQEVNAATAITAARLLGEECFPVSEAAIRQGLTAAVWPGRMELFPGPARMLLDGAHNPAGAIALRRALADFDYERLILVFGAMADKSWQEILQQLLPLADLLIAVKPSLDRAAEADELAAFAAGRGIKSITAGKVLAGLDYAKNHAGPADLILVTGSLFTVGEARATLVGGSFMLISG